MKNIFKYISLLAASAAMLLSCDMQEQNPVNGEEIHFTASIGKFQVRATDTAFEAGDEIALTCGYNPGITSKLVFDGTSLVPEEPVYWPAEATEYDNVPFYAVYPFVENANLSRGIHFKVNEDQSTHELYSASDLMVSIVRPSMKDGNTIHLPFIHKFSRLILKMDNRITGKSITGVSVENIATGSTIYDSIDYYWDWDEHESVKAGAVTLSDGTPAWAMILPPQNARITVKITTDDGAVYGYQAPEDIDLLPGHSYTATAIVTENSVDLDFTNDITDWVDGDDLTFHQGGNEPIDPEDPQGTVWSVIGSMPYSNWGTDIDLLRDDRDLYFTSVYAEAGEMFKIRKNHDWGVNYGAIIDENNYFDKNNWAALDAVQDGPNIEFPATGVWDIYFSPGVFTNDYVIYVFPCNTVHYWSIIGDVEDSNWSKDLYMHEEAFTPQGGDYTFASFYRTIEYVEGQSFFLRLDEGHLHLGTEKGQLYEGYNAVSTQGYSMSLPESGTYTIRYIPVLQSILVEKGSGSQDVIYGSIPDVFNGQDGSVFEVSGYVTNISNISYGNWYLADYEGNSLYIYGTVDANGNFPNTYSSGWYNDTFGLAPGDQVAVRGEKKTYNGVVELVNVTIQSSSKAPLASLVYYVQLRGDGGWFSLPVRANAPIEAVSDIEWISNVEVGSIDGSWYYLQAYCSANQGDVRSGAIRIISGDQSLEIVVEQDEVIVEYDTVQPVVESPDGTGVTVTSLVYAVSSRGFQLFDGKYSILVYTGANGHSVQIGDAVKVTGTKTTYNNCPEISNNNLRYEILSSGNELMNLDDFYNDVSAALDQNFADISIPIKVKGTLSNSGNYFNINTGCTRLMQVYWPSETILAGLQECVGKTVVVSGFSVGYNDYYQFILATSLTVEETSEPEPEGNGTLEEPYSASAAVTVANSLDANAYTSDYVYVWGIVSSVKETFTDQYGNATFNISDDGTTESAQFTVYRTYYFGGRRWTEANDANTNVAVGDAVIVRCQIQNYKGNTPESKNCQLVYLNDLYNIWLPEVVEFMGSDYRDATYGQLTGGYSLSADGLIHTFNVPEGVAGQKGAGYNNFRIDCVLYSAFTCDFSCQFESPNNSLGSIDIMDNNYASGLMYHDENFSLSGLYAANGLVPLTQDPDYNNYNYAMFSLDLGACASGETVLMKYPSLVLHMPYNSANPIRRKR